MTDFQLDLRRLHHAITPRQRALGAAIAVAVFGLAITDAILLRGDVILSETQVFSQDRVIDVPLQRVGEDHLFEIITREYRAGSHKGRPVSIRFEDENGLVVYENAELVSRERRYFRFNPVLAGTYRIQVKDNTLPLGRSRGSAQIKVWVNDRRLLRRLLP